MADSPLFTGEAGIFGGLSNEEELAELCPEEFQRHNGWSELASQIFMMGAPSTEGWAWKSDDEDEIRRQVKIFLGLLSGFGLSHQDKLAVAGWMLSEIVEGDEAPTFIKLEPADT